MRPFRFRLDVLLRLREAERDAARRELALALGGLTSLEAEERALELRLCEQQRRDRELRRSTTLAAAALCHADECRAELIATRRRLAEAHAQAADLVDQRQQQLAIAERQYQAIVQLRDRREADWRQQTARAEDKAVDEAAMRGHRPAA